MYYLFVEKEKFNTVKDILIDSNLKINCIDIKVGDLVGNLLPRHFILTTEMFGDKGVLEEIEKFFNSIGYYNKFKILKVLTKSQALIDFELVP